MSCSNPRAKIAWLLVLSVVILFAANRSVPAQSPSASPSSSQLRYRWQEGRVFAYEVEITADRDGYVDTMKGVVAYTAKAAEGDQLKVTCRGGVKRSRKTKPGQSSGAARGPFGPRFGPRSFPRGPRGLFESTPFKWLGTTTNTITLTSLGMIQSLEGDSQLPYLLGNLSLIVFEPLPQQAQSSWTVGSGVTITEKNERRTGPPFFTRPPGLPGSPFDRDDPDKRTAGSETTSFSIQDDKGRLVTASKRYQLSSPATDGQSFEISGSGTWVFNRDLGVSESLDFQEKLIVHDGNTTITVPVAIKYRRLSDAQLKQHQDEQAKQLEEAKQRLADLKRKQAEKPLTAEDKQKILENLKSDNVSLVLRGLQRLQAKTPKTPDPEIGAAVRALLDHKNRLVQQLAEKAAAKWPASGDAQSATDSEKDSPASTLRTWKDNTGQFTLEAEFLGLADGQVRLRRTDGREISVPLTRLSKADQEAAEQLSKNKNATTNPFEP